MRTKIIFISIVLAIITVGSYTVLSTQHARKTKAQMAMEESQAMQRKQAETAAMEKKKAETAAMEQSKAPDEVAPKPTDVMEKVPTPAM